MKSVDKKYWRPRIAYNCSGQCLFCLCPEFIAFLCIVFEVLWKLAIQTLYYDWLCSNPYYILTELDVG